MIGKSGGQEVRLFVVLCCPYSNKTEDYRALYSDLFSILLHIVDNANNIRWEKRWEKLRPINILNDKKIRSVTNPGRYADGAGLYLYVAKGGSKSWVYRWKRMGKRRELGLGGYPRVTLARARARAVEAREVILNGRDPIAERKRATEPTFVECVNLFLATMESQWRNEKHRHQWRMTLTKYCVPIANLPVSKIGTDEILTVLTPIWQSKHVTAARLRGRIERVLDFAFAKGWRTHPNPAIWRGNLKSVLPNHKNRTKNHHAALPYQEMPQFLNKLRSSESISSKALEFLILCAARTGEVLNATHDEISHNEAVWIVPGERMKMGKEHRVPLSPRALELSYEFKDVGRYCFPGPKLDGPMSNMAMAQLLKRVGYGHVTVHGFRSSFRDWAGDETNHTREVIEQALAHRLGDATERAYRRKDALEKRRQLMLDWEAFLNDIG